MVFNKKMDWGVRSVLSVIAFVFLIALGLKSIQGYSWDLVFVGSVSMLVGFYLLVESQIKKNYRKTFVGGGLKFKALFHDVSFALGFLLVYIGVMTLPSVGSILQNAIVSQYTSWVYFVGGLWALGEVWIN